MKKMKETNDEADILGRLQERVEKAISTIQELRHERDSLRAKLEQAEGKLREQESLEEDCTRFQKERGEIRNRIESILANLESLDSV